ncbi:ExbD/TolR family protein [Marinobacter sp. M1N3S26]|uniref:ExbD/TolR family protein n=1 Tax=unclassified Marinobacter TaxID=83889 RepID=UPI00387AA73F
MKESPRARRLRRHHRRTKNQGKLNLVSLMDIFTILVFFLMVNSSADNQLISDNPEIVLPESTSQQSPEDAPTLIVTADNILLNGQLIMTRADLEAGEAAVAPPLTQALSALEAPERVEETDAAGDVAAMAGRPVNILADQELPYAVLRKLMASCTEAGYSAISLAVTQKNPEGA